MARLECKCGHVMWNGETPNDIEYLAFSDRTMDKILTDDSVSTLEFAKKADYNVWLCPNCNRLYVFDNNKNKVEVIYKIEK